VIRGPRSRCDLRAQAHLHAMLAAMAAGHKTVDAGSVQQAVVDLEAS
jgi:hypothetical protein